VAKRSPSGFSVAVRRIPSLVIDEGVNGLLVAKCQYHAFARITFFSPSLSLSFYLFIYSTFLSAVCGSILTRGLQYRRALFSSSSSSSSSSDGGGAGGCGMVCRRWTESGGVVVHLASCRPQPVRRVRPLTVFIPRILDVQPAPLWSLRFCEGVPRQLPIEINYFVDRRLFFMEHRVDRNRDKGFFSNTNV